MPTHLADDLANIPLPSPGRARAVFVGGPPGSLLAALEGRGADEGFRVVTVRYDRVPELTGLIEDLVERLADLALAMWPGWPGCIEGREGVALGWLRAAGRLCERGRRPLVRGGTATTSARQLARAIDPGPILFALALDDEAPRPGSLLVLARAAEWLAREARGRALVVVPAASEASPELDSVAFDAIRIVEPGPPPATTPAPTASTGRTRVSPLIGEPNPSSGGEKKLADRLSRDPELAGLFRFNVHVETVRHTRPLVDLVWEAGKVVVEVDGYYFHSDPQAFSRDRRRDYELTASGYLVLRLPEDEVADDVALAVEKIRDVVAVRKPSHVHERL